MGFVRPILDAICYMFLAFLIKVERTLAEWWMFKMLGGKDDL